jgi:hypothetical protein
MQTIAKALLVLPFIFLSCGEFIGFDSLPGEDIGDITKVYIYLNEESLEKLYESVSESDYAPCIYQINSSRTEALIKVRGFTSRLDPKKSFTIKISDSLQYAFEAAYDTFITNRLAMFTYNKAGLFAPEATGVGLYINNEYLGYYNRLVMYNEKDLKSHYNGKDAELFKANFLDMGNDIPLHSLSEKKFPDDNDFSNLDILIYYAKTMSDEEWSQWIEKYMDRDEIVKYLAVCNFLAVRDIAYLNFYVYNYGRMLFLPWDNERCMDLDNPTLLIGNSMLTKKLLRDPYIRSQYNNSFRKLFLTDRENIEDYLNLDEPLLTENIIDDLLVELERIVLEVEPAILNEPTDYFTYDEFLEEVQRIRAFLYGRSSQIPEPALE